MIPSIVAAEVAQALRDFLATGFAPSNPELSTIIDDFLAEPENLFKGPYLSVSLPFDLAAEGGEPFPHVPLGFIPYRHQRTAFMRLAGSEARSTLITTATGSGKTECFLFPILDYCRQRAGEAGVKAVLVYPMNALANDQALRIARTIHGTPALRGRVTAGLFVGRDHQPQQSPQTTMAPDHIITDRDTLRERPPDILLTNYKMLDYLLVRPLDFPLWRHNQPETLRYLVVDELHTFDGAQGTDLACLIRRLRMRLRTPPEKLVCVGTSATIGDEQQGDTELREYATRIFGRRFEAGSVIGAVRQSREAFLGDSPISGILPARKDLAEIVAPDRYDSPEEYLRAQHKLFFDAPIEEPFESQGWRLELADRLREHVAFVNLLRVLEGRPQPMQKVVQRIRRTLPVGSDVEAEGVVNALCALISVALDRDAGQAGQSDVEASTRPFLQVGLHLWVRELRRMVCSLHEGVPQSSDPSNAEVQDSRVDDALPDRTRLAPPPTKETAKPAAIDPLEPTSVVRRLRHSDDLQPKEPSIHLPLIQCRECRVTGWGAVKSGTEQHLGTDLRVFYNRFFAGDVDVQYLFPAGDSPAVPGLESTICGGCGRVHGAKEDVSACADCRSQHLERVVQPLDPAGGTGRRSRHCPYCGAREALIILGARAASLLSVTLGQSFGSRYNDDRKVIAFSDNVQDAAHRAGFFAARTWRENLRAAIAQVVKAAPGGRVRLADLPDQVEARWRDTERYAGAFDDESFVSEFIAPDKQWLRDYTALQRDGRLPVGSNLPQLVARRLRWDTLAELGYRSAIGRTLERTRTLAVGTDRAALRRACDDLHRRVTENFGALRELPVEPVRHLVLGIVRRMKNRGAIQHELVAGYLHGGSSLVPFNRRQLALQEFGPRSPRPIFPAQGQRGKNDNLEPVTGARGGIKSWYLKWAEKLLATHAALLTNEVEDVLYAALAALERAGLVLRLEVARSEAHRATVWALNSALLHATTAPTVLSCAQSPGRDLIVDRDEADLWLGAPCLDLDVPGDTYQSHCEEPPTWFGKQYLNTAIRRIVAAEHTALLGRAERERLQQAFSAPRPRPWDPNLISATPTLELGIDIGNLSMVVLCSVPPAQANYLQRIGRAGRRDGNSFTATVATGQPHDLYFYAEPEEMLAGRVKPPGVFLNAPAVLERQLTAYCFDAWAASELPTGAVPREVRSVLDNVRKERLDRFPYPFLAFVQARGETLLEQFFQAFSDDLTDATKDDLRAFLFGADVTSKSLGLRIVERFRELAEECRALRNEARSLAARSRKLGDDPQDDRVESERKQLDLEAGGLRQVARHIEEKNTFNFLTEEGLLPNYAFPEAGVMLKSLVYRRRQAQTTPGEAGESETFASELESVPQVFEYVRPAAAALSEFAPEGSFYAGGRRVEIDRVDLRVSQIERWRLCPSCDHCEKLDGKDDYSACPHCGNPMWADSGQTREMLPLKLVHASADDRQSRILDDYDDREPLFYTRHVVADFAPDATQGAFTFGDEGTAFGFEYVSSATFREMNFGRMGGRRNPMRFAGISLPEEGFRICRRCGKVQGADGKPAHTGTCTDRNDIADCLYLYRQFDSEAIQVLLPGVEALGSGRRVNSFVAALELGLKEYFGGPIDHLRVTLREGSGQGGPGGLHRYLLLYDTVPSGTGYLKQLMARPDNLLEVLRAARQALKSCECNEDPIKDGCYRCVFAYRRSRDMAETSRDAAIKLLESIPDSAEDIEAVPNLSGVKVASLVQSQLEARFLDSLNEGDVDGTPVQIHAALVGGKDGFVLRVGEHTYHMLPQLHLGEYDGVVEGSRPDFVIRPSTADSTTPPVAVFLDGFEYHREATGADSAKRTALARSDCLVWSLTWHDLEVAFGPPHAVPDFLAMGGANGMARLQQELDARLSTRDLRAKLGRPSLALLVHYLREPAPERWRHAVFTELLAQFEQRSMSSATLRVRYDQATHRELPSVVRAELEELPGEGVAVGGRGNWLGTEPGLLDVFLALPHAALQEPIDANALAAVLHLHDDSASREDERYQDAWNGALKLFNLLQFLPGAWWTTRQGVEQDLYRSLPHAEESLPRQEQLSAGGAAWLEAIELADASTGQTLIGLSELGAPAPVVGFELANESGKVLAEAELAWPGCSVAVLLSGGDASDAFAGAGWQVFEATAGGLTHKLAGLLPGVAASEV